MDKTSKTDEPTIFIVDDDDAIREVLECSVRSIGFRVQSFETASAFLEAYDGTRPGCLVLDVRMPGMSGFDLQNQLSERGVTLPIIMITAYAEVPMAVRAMRNGAVDFIQKPFEHQVFLDRVREAVENDCRARRIHGERAEVAARLASLTPRQREVLDGVLAGKPSKVIAYELGLSPQTVGVHRARLMQRMQAQSAPDLFRLVVLSGGDTARVPEAKGKGRPPRPRRS